MGNDLKAFRELFLQEPVLPPEITDPNGPCWSRRLDGSKPHRLVWHDGYAVCRDCYGHYVDYSHER